MRIVYVVSMLGFAACGAKAAAPAAPTPPADVPAELAVPAGHKLAFAVQATGVQIYECDLTKSAPEWKLHAPRADLADDKGAAIGIHYGGVDKNLPAGAYWESTADHSRVHAGKPASHANPGSIALLRLEASDTSGNGMFGKVSYVQRLATKGGVAPATVCTAGQTVEVPYTATYYFYVAAGN